MNLLHTIGLMTRAEHERKVEILDDLLAETRAAESTALAQFKRAATDLAAQADEIAALKMSAGLDNDTILGLRSQLEAAEQVIAELKPDAEKFRAKATRDAESKRAKRAAAKAG